MKNVSAMAKGVEGLNPSNVVTPALVEPGIDGREIGLADHPPERIGKLIVADDGGQGIVADARVAEHGEPLVPAISIRFDRLRFGLA
jgi:hypothetical protein